MDDEVSKWHSAGTDRHNRASTGLGVYDITTGLCGSPILVHAAMQPSHALSHIGTFVKVDMHSPPFLSRSKSSMADVDNDQVQDLEIGIVGGGSMGGVSLPWRGSLTG